MEKYSNTLLYNFAFVSIMSLYCFLYVFFDKKTKQIKFIDLMAALFLVLFAGLRRNVGSDYYAYYLKFDYYSGVDFSYIDNVVSEKIFALYCIFVGKIFSDPLMGFWVTAVILYVPLVYLCRKITQKPSLCVTGYVFLGYLGMSFNIIRQMIAMELLIFFYFLLIKQKYIGAILVSILSVGIHKSAIIAIILIISSLFIKPTFNKLILFTIIGTILTFTIQPILNYVFNAYPILSKFYKGYIDNFESYGKMRMTIGIWGYVLFYWLMVLVLVTKKKFIKNSFIGAENIISMIIIGIPLSIMATKLWLFNRISVYLYQFSIFFIPEIIKQKFKGFSKFEFWAFFILLLFGWFNFISLFGCENLYNEYHFAWESIKPDYY